MSARGGPDVAGWWHRWRVYLERTPESRPAIRSKFKRRFLMGSARQVSLEMSDDNRPVRRRLPNNLFEPEGSKVDRSGEVYVGNIGPGGMRNGTWNNPA